MGRKEKVWTVIVFNHFSKELMGFLSNATTVEKLHFTQRKDELAIINENEAKAILGATHALKEEEDMIRNLLQIAVMKNEYSESILILRLQK